MSTNTPIPGQRWVSDTEPELGLGIILKGGHLLSAFGASSVPAAILILCLVMGKNVAGTFGSIGILLMWSSLLILGLLTAVIYRKLLKT